MNCAAFFIFAGILSFFKNENRLSTTQLSHRRPGIKYE